MRAPVIVTILAGFVAYTTVHGQTTMTNHPSSTTTAPIVPKRPEKGLVLSVMDDWNRNNQSAQLRHLFDYPGVDGNVGNDSNRVSFTNENIHFLSIDVDYRRSYVYMYDYHYSIVVIGANYSANMNTSEMEFKIMHFVLSRGTVQVAYDWLSNTLYWCDAALKMIVAASGDWDKVKDDRYKILAQGHLNEPDGIAVDPTEGYLFWSDTGTAPKIERSLLDGSQRHTIVTVGLKQPMTLEVDFREKRIYWIDIYKETISSADYDGNNIKFLTTFSGSTLFDLAILQDALYVTDLAKERMYTVNKKTGKKMADYISYGDMYETIYGVSVYSEENQPLKATDYCAQKKCEHMCVSEKQGAKCLCAEGFRYNEGTKKCDEFAGAFHKAFVYANASHICLVDIRALIDVNYFPPVCRVTMIKQKRTSPPPPPNRRKRQVTEPSTKLPTTMNSTNQSQPPMTKSPTTTPKTTKLPPTTTKVPPTTTTLPPTTTTTPPPTVAPEDSIRMIELDMQERNVFIVTMDNRIFLRDIDLPIENDKMEELTEASDVVTGVAFDPEDRILYWSQINGDIRFIKISGKDVGMVTVNAKPRKPKDLIMLIDERKLAFIAGEEDDMSIMTVNLDGSNMRSILEASDSITSLVFERETELFYYLLAGKGRVYTLPLNIEQDPDFFTSKPNSKTYILLEYHTYLVWVYAYGSYPNLIMTVEKTRPSQEVGHNRFDNVSTIVDMKILDAEKQAAPPGLCSKNNGGCSQICLSMLEMGRPYKKCQCKKGYILEADGQTCTSDPFLDRFLLFSDWTNDELLQIHTDTNELRAIPERDSYLYVAVYLDPDTLRIFWSAFYDSYIYSSNLNGTDVRVEADLWYSFPYKFDKDSSTGNMYYISYFYQHVGIVTPYGDNLWLNEDFFYEDLTAIVVHPGNGHVYYAVIDYGDAYIARSDMDGKNVKRLMDGEHVKEPEGLAIDFIHDHLYVSDYAEDTVRQCDLDGQNCITIVNTTDMHITEIVTDGVYLYYTSFKQDYVVRVELKPPYNHIAIGGGMGLGKINTLSYYSSDNKNVQAVDNACLENYGKGDCSTICLPTPTGRTCACEVGISLQPDGRTCANVHLCIDIITQKNTATNETLEISFHSTCLRRENSVCEYKCPPNYVPVDKSKPTLTCQIDGWDRETHPLCEEIRCPSIFENGAVDMKCSKNVGSVCKHFTCNNGYTTLKKDIFCREDGLWHSSDDKICTEFRCDASIKKGTLDPSCDRTVGSKCSFTCDKYYDFAPPQKVSEITCGAKGWNMDTNALCKDAMCDESSLMNGVVVANCVNHIGRSCQYTCDTLFTNVTEEVVCKFDQKWHPSQACKTMYCPMEIENGMVDKRCSREVNSECRYLCNDKFKTTKLLGKIKCMPSGKWNESTNLCLEKVVQPQKQEGTTSTQTAVTVVAVILAIFVIGLIVLALFLFKRRRSSSAYATASFKNGSNIAIENPGYNETNMGNLEVKDDHPYSTVNPNHLQVQFPDQTDDGIPNPLYGNEPLPEVAHVDVNQDKTVLTQDSWLKERANQMN